LTGNLHEVLLWPATLNHHKSALRMEKYRAVRIAEKLWKFCERGTI